jgi:hypothetical protein
MSQIVRSGQNLAPTFMHDFPQPGALPILAGGEVIGAMGVLAQTAKNAPKRRSMRCLRTKRLPQHRKPE